MKQISEARFKAYTALISKIESNDNPKAKNPLSTASGRFQFIKSTWEGLGYNWADRFDDAVQYAAFRKLTEQNEAILIRAGCAINFATLYGAHFLGPQGLLKVMRGAVGAPIETVTSAGQRKANPTILKGTILDFCKWLERKTGESVYRRDTQGGWVSGPDVVMPPDEPTSAPLTQGRVFGALVFFLLGGAYIVFKALGFI